MTTEDTSNAIAPHRPSPLRPALVLTGLLLVAANLRAGITTVGPVLGEIQSDLALSSVAASLLISLPLLAFAAISPLAPALARRIGLERTLGAALAVLATGLIVRSLPGLVWLWTGTALLGVAIAVLNVVLPALVKRDFPTRIGQVTGTYSAVQGTFAALAAGVAVPLAGATSLGWRLPLGVWAGLAIIAIAVMLPQFRRSTGATHAQAASAQAERATRSVWRSPLAWQISAFMGIQSVAYYILITWLPTIEAAAGVPEAEAGLHQLLLNAFGIVGSLTASALIPRLGDQRWLAVAGGSLFLITVVGVLFAPEASGLWACTAGLGGGTSIVLALSFFGLRTRHHLDAASLSGMAQSIGYVLAAAGPIGAGLLHDATGSWTPVLVTLAALTGLHIVFGYLAGRDRVIT